MCIHVHIYYVYCTVSQHNDNFAHWCVLNVRVGNIILTSLPSTMLYFAQSIPNHACANCSQVSNITSKKRIANAPEVLVFYFRRFIKSGFFQTKENTLIDFPLENFDITDFLDMTSGYFKGGWDQKAIYDLQVLVRHVGKNKESNHYSTMARHDPEGKWFEYHDHRVRVVSRRHVASKEALMLFYVRRKPPAQGTGGAGMTEAPAGTAVSELQQAVRGAVLERRELLVDEINYLLHMDRVRQVNVLKNSLTQKTNRLILSVRKSLRTSVKLITNMKLKLPLKKTGSSSEFAKDEREVVDTVISTAVVPRRKELYSLASFAEVVMTEANLSKSRRCLGPGWRTVKRSLQKIVMLGRDPSLIFDHAHIILEVPPRKHVFVSIYWLIKFLSFSEPGPLCNHDIVCCHGGLKPHLYGCRKRICIPIAFELFKNIRHYLHEQYSYPNCLLPNEMCANTLDANEIIFRELK
jgi:hypothetical protein